MSKNEIHQLDDGRIEIRFAIPIKTEHSKFLILDIGWHEKSELIVEKGMIIGVRVYPHVWHEVLKRNSTEDIVKEFEKIVGVPKKCICGHEGW
jgi:autonomous glycyl radical cofactor GrcA